MSAPLVPSPLDFLGHRKFVLYPPIANGGPNAWVRGKTSWAETQLVNAVTGRDVWVPWQYICGVSDKPGSDLVVELKEDLEFRDGNISPRVRRVIPMPLPDNPSWRRKRKHAPAPVIAIRAGERHPGGKIALILALLCVLVGMLLRFFKF